MQAQPLCTLSLDARAAPSRSVRPGQKLKLSIRWINRGVVPFTNGIATLQLPLHTALAKPSMVQRGRKVPRYDPATRVVTWSGLSIGARSRVTLAAKVKVEACYPGPQLAFQTTAYLGDPADSTVMNCLQQDTTVVVRE